MGVCKWRNRQSGELNKGFEKPAETQDISNAICATEQAGRKSLNGKSEVSAIDE